MGVKGWGGGESRGGGLWGGWGSRGGGVQGVVGFMRWVVGGQGVVEV